MLALWRLGRRASIPEIIEVLAEDPPPAIGKIRIFLRRIRKKGFVDSEDAGRPDNDAPLARGRPVAKHYFPTVRREDAVRDEIRWFVEARLAGDPDNVALLQEFVENYRPGRRLKAARFRRKKP